MISFSGEKGLKRKRGGMPGEVVYCGCNINSEAEDGSKE